MKATPKKTRRRTSANVPPGLQYAFRLIDIDGYPQDAGDVLPHALKIIDNMNHATGRPNGPIIEDELMAAAGTIFPPQKHDPSTDPGNNPVIASVGGFYTGFAVCWLLMTQINGGGR